jgi:hypothetical protein
MPTLYDYGPAVIDLRFVRGDDFSMVVDVEGDRDADAFAAALRTKKVAAVVAFTTAVGAYNAGLGTTPVTITMADTTTDDLTPGQYLWDLEWTASGGAVRTIASGAVTVLEDYTA